MTISKELEAKVLRYHFVEHWRVNTIANQLGIHHTTVERVLAQVGTPRVERSQRQSIIDPYQPFILETLEKFPTLTATRLHAMVIARGYPGGESHFRHLIGELRPRKPPEAYLRLKTLPGEQGQVDWGVFGDIEIGKAKRSLMAFVMVLSWSRQIFLRFYLNQQTANFLRGHEAAFNAWGGLPKVLLYDNLKSAVLERRRDAIRFNPTLLDFATHYRYEPRPVAPYRGNQKGRVERAIRFIRSAFFAGRQWRDLDDLNAQAEAWCLGASADRRWPEDPSLTVREAFEQEKPTLSSLPENPYPTDDREEVSVGKTPYVRFDLNDYSIPHTEVRQTLTVVASLTQVRILKGQHVIAQHPRSFDKGEQVEDLPHIDALAQYKRNARRHRGQDRLSRSVPSSEQLLIQAAERGYVLATVVSHLNQLLDDYGASELDGAIEEALQQGVPHPNAVRLALERRREQRDQPPPLAVALSAAQKAKDVAVRPASLDVYDAISNTNDTTKQDPTTDNGEANDNNES